MPRHQGEAAMNAGTEASIVSVALRSLRRARRVAPRAPGRLDASESADRSMPSGSAAVLGPGPASTPGSHRRQRRGRRRGDAVAQTRQLVPNDRVELVVPSTRVRPRDTTTWDGDPGVALAHIWTDSDQREDDELADLDREVAGSAQLAPHSPHPATTHGVSGLMTVGAASCRWPAACGCSSRAPHRPPTRARPDRFGRRRVGGSRCDAPGHRLRR